MDWSQIPDLAAVGLLSCAFASLAKQQKSRVSGLWLTGWLLIGLHFAAAIFLAVPGIWGDLADLLCLASLANAGVLFMYSVVPYHEQRSNRFMLFTLLSVTTLYIGFLIEYPLYPWGLIVASVLIGLAPLGLSLIALPSFRHPLRWILVSQFLALSAFLLVFQRKPGNGGDLALNGLLFVLYLGCCLHFAFVFRRTTAGSLITIAGFAAWALVFFLGPLLATLKPTLVIESEVWNLPKYLVAVGMILLLLEEQIEHNRFLALHDDLTGLPNRRLFLDRLKVAIMRAERLRSSVALLVVDLNGFKEVNDRFGHHAGDEVLKAVARAFDGRMRKCDTVARTGGDEFSIILEDTEDHGDAHRVARNLQELVAKPLLIASQEIHIGASIGIAAYPADAADLESLCIVADRRMYRWKEGTRSAAPGELQTGSGSSPVGASLSVPPREQED